MSALEGLTSPTLKKVLEPLEADGVNDKREQLILWIIRNQYGVGAEDSFASILDQRDIFPGVIVDAVLVTTRRDIVSPVYVIYEENPENLEARVAALVKALSASSSAESTLAKSNPQLRSLFEPATDRRITSEVTRLILCISSAEIPTRLRNRVTRRSSSAIDIDVIDSRFINALAEADLSPTTAMPTVHVAVDPRSILNLGMRDTMAIITPVSADQIANWDGVDDRRLFDLNVRHALGLNRVRKSLNQALRNRESADEFIAYHNGITAVCSDFRVTDGGIEVDGLSIVNGAQTVVAIHANAGHLAPGLRVLFKLVKAGPETDLAQNMAVRSNTQNPVTSRNLRALDEVQARLQAELGALGYVYTRRPNDKEAVGPVVRNDDVAQLLCSIYVRKPALAVKRQVLFESPLYEEIFPSNVDPARLIFATLLRKEVDSHKEEVPVAYQSAWALTALTLVNMAAEAMRDDSSAAQLLLSPGDAIRDSLQVQEVMSPFVNAAVSALRDREAAYSAKKQPDEFKIAFKQTRTLSDLAMQASKAYRRRRPSVNS
ncbi:AIPR protein [Clavibacter michiganensis]|uniref:AIPR protein n=1 Tax=Clavibacter michiganensis TaxID=28447 RepID=A0A251XY66_9MICO|nr:AIPR protein [Clavibacter michiganensis]